MKCIYSLISNTHGSDSRLSNENINVTDMSQCHARNVIDAYKKTDCSDAGSSLLTGNPESDLAGYVIVALADSLPPLLSFQLNSTSSPGAPPVKVKDRNGFIEMVGPHSAVITGSPW
jgi:hypothetical protein